MRPMETKAAQHPGGSESSTIGLTTVTYSELEVKDIDEVINCLFQMTTYEKTEKTVCKKGGKHAELRLWGQIFPSVTLNWTPNCFR